MLKSIVFFVLLMLVGSMGICEAAFKTTNSINDNIRLQLKKDDILLPMPDGQEMILRAVAVPVGSLLRDRVFAMGVNGISDSGRQIYESRHAGHISSPFTYRDLPVRWKKTLAGDGMKNNSYAWYFIGKYEVTRGQWSAVMDLLSPEGKLIKGRSENVSDPNLPITNISWFQALDFLNRYNLWLIENYGQNLPVFAGTKNMGYLRLPTEEEWEYAARGGGNVPPEWWEDQDFFPMDEHYKIADYAIFREPRILQRPLAIGSRKANPLGLYDTAGNVREMTQGFFRMSIPEFRDDKLVRRLHGSSGGIVVKGGGYRSEESALLPGAREEVPLYSLEGAFGASDLGFRIVLGGINFPGGERLAELKKEEVNPLFNPEAKNGLKLTDDMSVKEMASAILNSSKGSNRQELERLLARIGDQEKAEEERTAKNIESMYHALLYQSETLRAFALRYVSALAIRNTASEQLESARGTSAEKAVLELLERSEDQLRDFGNSLEMGARYYKTSLSEICDNSAEALDHLAEQAKMEYSGSGVFNKHMRENINILEKNIKMARSMGLKALTPKSILKSVLPNEYYAALPASLKN